MLCTEESDNNGTMRDKSQGTQESSRDIDLGERNAQSVKLIYEIRHLLRKATKVRH